MPLHYRPRFTPKKNLTYLFTVPVELVDGASAGELQQTEGGQLRLRGVQIPGGAGGEIVFCTAAQTYSVALQGDWLDRLEKKLRRSSKCAADAEEIRCGVVWCFYYTIV